MKTYEATEQAYKNGYKQGYEDGKKDAVEVVRCKDCKDWGQDVNSYTGEDESFCMNPDGLDNYAHPDDFCSYGERKDNE